jgi:hyperosmotically inducible periplasmic protein
MNSIRAAATGASLVLLAALAACGDRAEHAQVPRAQASTGTSVPTAPDGNVHSLGAKGGTSVLDPDVLIAEQVKSALATRPEFGTSSGVDVHSEDGDVTLRGRAPDPGAKERAEAIARSIPKVKSVNNELTLG